MQKMTKKVFIALLVLGMLQACTHLKPLNHAEREALSDIVYVPTVIEDGAYQLPDVNLYIGPEYLTEGGLLPVLYSDVLEAMFMQFEQDKLAEKNHADLKIIAAQHVDDMAGMLDKKIQTVLAQNTFFAPRMRKASGNRFRVYLERYGLRRAVEGDNKTVILKFSLALRVELLDSTDKKTFAESFYADSPSRYTLQTYAKNTHLIQQTAIQAVDNLGHQLKQFLLQKTVLKPS
jgi:hypothetical protein